MTLGDCKRKALELIFQYSIAGTAIPSSYNNQADYINRIPNLVNSAQTEIAVTVKPIQTTKAVSALTPDPVPLGGRTVHVLPADCFRVMDGGLLRVLPEGIVRTKNYRLLYGNRIVIFENDLSDMILEYLRYPTALTAASADTAELDNTPDAQECVPYYVAAHLVLYDDPYRYSALYNEYLRRIAQLRHQTIYESNLIRNEYGS